MLDIRGEEPQDGEYYSLHDSAGNRMMNAQAEECDGTAQHRLEMLQKLWIAY